MKKNIKLKAPAPEAPGFKDFLKINWKAFAIFFFAVFLTYVNTFFNQLVSDDIPYITRDPNIGNFMSGYNFQTIKGFFYTWDYFLDKTNPLPYHLTNILIHSGVVFLAFYFLSKIIRKRLAFWAVLVFAVHPLNSEAVTWISGRAYPVYALFLLLAFLAYLRAKSPPRKIFWHGSAFILFWLSASANSFAIAFPLLLVSYELCFGGWKKNLGTISLYFLLAVARIIYISPLITTRVEFLGPQVISSSDQGQNLFSSLVSLWNYAYLFLFPKNLSFYHEDLSGAYEIKYLLLILTLVIFSLLPFIYKHSRSIFFGLSFYALSLAATIAPIKVGWIVAERYSYLGNLGLALVLICLLFKLFEKLKLNRGTRIACLVSIVIVLSGRTFIRNFDWKDEDSLWLATAKASPTSSKAWNNMGDYYGRHGEMQKSFEAFVKATELNPSYSDAWHNAGNTLVQVGKYDESIPYFEKSLQFNPNLIEAYNNLALVYHKKGDQVKSMEMINKSLAINPQAVKTYMLLALIEYENKNVEKSIEAIQKGLTIDPTNEVLQKNLKILQQIKPQTLPSPPNSTSP